MTDNINTTLSSIGLIFNNQDILGEISKLIELELDKLVVIPNKITVLSYNVCHDAMIGTNKNCTIKSQMKMTDCYENVIKFMDNGKYEFIGAQETSYMFALDQIYLKTLNLSSMNYVFNQSIELTSIITFYDNKYVLDNGINTINSYMFDSDSPITILFFRGNLCVINVLLGKNNNLNNFDTHLKEILENNKPISPTFKTYTNKGSLKTTFIFNNNKDIITDTEKESIISKLKTYDIIMMGDFGDEIGPSNVFLIDPFYNIPSGRTFNGRNTIKTCCDPDIQFRLFKNGFFLKDMEYAHDNILSTMTNVKTTVLKVLEASNHFPITAEITK